MADSTLDSEKFWLFDTWPGVPKTNESPPLGGFNGATETNVATAKRTVGEKIQVIQTGVSAGGAGYSTFIYLQLDDTALTNPCLVKHICSQAAEASSGGDYFYCVTNDSGNDLAGGYGPVAIAVASMTASYYGWFWCGGVCPEGLISGLGGNYATLGTVVIGNMIVANLAGGTLDAATYGELGFGPDAAGAHSTLAGYSVSDDA